MAESSSSIQYLQEVGRRIKSLRTQRGFTLADLGENIGLDKSNTFRLEQGKNFTLLTLVKIAAFLNVHPKEILEVPFAAEFVDIEQDIAEKRKKRLKEKLGSKSTQKKATSAPSPYSTRRTTTPIAADKVIKRKKA